MNEQNTNQISPELQQAEMDQLEVIASRFKYANSEEIDQMHEQGVIQLYCDRFGNEQENKYQYVEFNDNRWTLSIIFPMCITTQTVEGRVIKQESHVYKPGIVGKITDYFNDKENPQTRFYNLSERKMIPDPEVDLDDDEDEDNYENNLTLNSFFPGGK